MSQQTDLASFNSTYILDVLWIRTERKLFNGGNVWAVINCTWIKISPVKG